MWKLAAIVVIIRLGLLVTHPGYVGVDGGAYLLQARQYLGLSLPQQLDFVRAPLGPGWLLVPFVVLMGNDIGYSVWEAIFSTVPILPAFYLLATRFVSPRAALVATVFLAVDMWQWEMVITGALPLIGIGLIFLCLWGLVGVTSGRPTLREKLAVVLSIGLIPYINQTSTGLAAVAIPVFLLSLCVLNKSPKALRSAFPYLASGALIAVGALPWYRDVLPGSAKLSFPGPMVYMQPFNSPGWIQVWFAVPFGLWVAWRSSNTKLKALAITMVVHSLLTLFSSYDESIINIFFRSMHLVSPLLVLMVAWTAVRLVPYLTKYGVAFMASLLFILLVIGSGYVFQKQAFYSDMITPEMDRARGFIPDGDTKTIVTNGFMTGLWLAALEGTPTVWTFSANPPPAFQAQYKETQCLLGWREDCNPWAAADRLNAEYVLIDMRFPHITSREPNLWGAPEDTWAPTLAAPWLDLVYTDGTVRLWRVKRDA